MAAVDSQQARDAWKTHCLRRIHLESKMARGSKCDYTHKTLIGHTGRVVGLVYLQKNSPTIVDPWSFRSTFYTASTDGTVRAWDVKDGVELWCSPVQSPLTSIVSVMEHGLVITSDSSGLIKSWHAHTGQEMASFPTASTHCTLLPYTINNSHFISVGTDSGTVETLSGITGPAWSKRSSLVVCEPFVKVNLLVLSPDKKWIFAGTKGNRDSSPKVFWADSLTKEDPLCQSLHRRMQSIIECHAAVFMPDHPARLAVVYKKYNYALIVQDIRMKQSKSKSEIQVKKLQNSGLWLSNKVHDILLEAKDSDTLVLSDGEQFQVLFKGMCTKNHNRDILSMSVDRFRMVVASHVYLKVFTWKRYESQLHEQAKERYQLGGSLHLFRHNWAFTHVICDYSSIVGAVQCNGGKDELVAFSFTS